MNLKSVQDIIALDILSSETRYSLLKQSSCKYLTNESILSDELNTIGARLEFMEKQLGVEDKDVLQLKKYYSLLEIKDYQLMSELSEKCDTDPVFVLYFYSNDCDDCKRQGYVLDSLLKKYPELRVYSFDSNLDAVAIRTLISIFGVTEKLPTIFLEKKLHVGFQEMETLEAIISPKFPEISEEESQETNVELE